MANIILTNVCNSKCEYCFATSAMAEFSERGMREMKFSDYEFVLFFLKKNGEQEVRLLGGEPTLHSNFKKIINFSLEHGFVVRLFTNGNFDENTALFLNSKGEKVKYSLNINPPGSYSGTNWERINNNLSILAASSGVVLILNIHKINFNYEYIIFLAKLYPIKSIYIIVDFIPVGARGHFFPEEEKKIFVKNFLKMTAIFNSNKIKYDFGCGLDKNIFSEKEREFVFPGKKHLWGCDLNRGFFDILPDLSLVRCFPLCNLENPRKNLREFSTTNEIHGYFKKLIIEKIENARSLMENGPCLGFFTK